MPGEQKPTVSNISDLGPAQPEPIVNDISGLGPAKPVPFVNDISDLGTAQPEPYASGLGPAQNPASFLISDLEPAKSEPTVSKISDQITSKERFSKIPAKIVESFKLEEKQFESQTFIRTSEEIEDEDDLIDGAGGIDVIIDLSLEHEQLQDFEDFFPQFIDRVIE